MKKLPSLATLSLLLSAPLHAQTPDQAQAAQYVRPTLIAELGPNGQKISAIALEYEHPILSGSHVASIYDIQTELNQQNTGKRTIIKTYTNNQAKKSHQPQAGKFLILELSPADTNADPYQLRVENQKAQSFRALDAQGQPTTLQKVQANRVPEYHGKQLVYHIQQNGHLKLSNGKTLDKTSINIDASQLSMPDLQHFTPHTISDPKQTQNQLKYQKHTPPEPL